ncbi:MAG TPA: ABC transporter substrate-binding protein [Actinomycetota bacterium]|nr:ABC transporter substrate-binding protein [Actinomycetota bacterium]
MNRARFVALLAAAALVASACGGGEGDNGGGDGEVVQIDFLQPLPKSIAFYPLFVGERLGYFEEEGVRVNLLPSGDIPATVAVPSGNADIGSTTPAEILVGAAQGEDFVLIYEYYQKNVFSIVVPEDSDVQDVAGLEGRNVGITSQVGGDAALARAALTEAGLDPESDVTLTVVGEGGPTVANALQNGDIDAFSGAINDLVALQVEGIGFRNITPSSLDVLPASSMIAQTGQVEEQADAFQGFLRAWAKATYAGLYNRDAVFEMAREEVPEEAQDEEFGRVFLDQAIELQTPVEGEDSFGALRPDAWTAVMEQLIEGGELEETFDPNTFLDDRFIAGANDWDRGEVEQEIDDWLAENG